MRNYGLLLMTVLASCFLQQGLSAKCNDDVIAAIQNLWTNTEGPTVSLKEQLIRNRVSHIVATSPGIFKNEDNISCLQAITTDRDYFMNIVFNDGSMFVTKRYEIEELQEDLYTPVDAQHRYHIPTLPSSNVQAFYTCLENGSSGDDRGLIRVLGRSNPLTEDAVNKAISDFAELGITISTFYLDRCENKPQ